MLKEWAVLAVTIVTLLAPTLSCRDVFAQSTGAAHKPFLRGSVEHSEQLTPVQSGLKVGDTFDQSKLEKGAATKNWYKVPPWLAGTWEHDDQTQTSYLDYKTGVGDSKTFSFQSHSTDGFGYQRDRLGGIWDSISVPYFAESVTDKELHTSLHTDDSVIFDSDDRVIMRFICTRTTVDKATNTISSVNQTESFNSYVPYGPNMVRTEYSIKYFDQRGNPIDLSKGWSIERRVALFKLSSYDPSFGEYLKTNGMENLVPLQQ